MLKNLLISIIIFFCFSCGSNNYTRICNNLDKIVIDNINRRILVTNMCGEAVGSWTEYKIHILNNDMNFGELYLIVVKKDENILVNIYSTPDKIKDIIEINN